MVTIVAKRIGLDPSASRPAYDSELLTDIEIDLAEFEGFFESIAPGGLNARNGATGNEPGS